MVCTNFKREERKEYIKKNVVGDNPTRNNQHVLSLEKKDATENPMTQWKKVF
jgi:hypothetical protein